MQTWNIEENVADRAGARVHLASASRGAAIPRLSPSVWWQPECHACLWSRPVFTKVLRARAPRPSRFVPRTRCPAANGRNPGSEPAKPSRVSSTRRSCPKRPAFWQAGGRQASCYQARPDTHASRLFEAVPFAAGRPNTPCLDERPPAALCRPVYVCSLIVDLSRSSSSTSRFLLPRR